MATAGVIAMTTGFAMMAVAGPAQAKPAVKVFVCKYVSTPGEAERLQTGNNPISVSSNAIKGYAGIGSWFNDAQGRSYVLAEDLTRGGGQAGEPDASECPQPSTDLLVAPAIDVNDPCGTKNDSVDGVENANYSFVVDDDTVTFTIAVDGYVFEGETLTAELTADFTNEACEVIVTTDVCPNIAGNQAEIPAGLVKVNGQCGERQGTESTAPTPDKKPTIKGTEAVPTAVAAGIGGNGPTITGSSPIDLLAQMLVGGGLALLMAAGWLQIGRQTNGAHLN